MAINTPPVQPAILSVDVRAPSSPSSPAASVRLLVALCRDRNLDSQQLASCLMPVDALLHLLHSPQIGGWLWDQRRAELRRTTIRCRAAASGGCVTRSDRGGVGGVSVIRAGGQGPLLRRAADLLRPARPRLPAPAHTATAGQRLLLHPYITPCSAVCIIYVMPSWYYQSVMPSYQFPLATPLLSVLRPAASRCTRSAWCTGRWVGCSTHSHSPTGEA